MLPTVMSKALDSYIAKHGLGVRERFIAPYAAWFDRLYQWYWYERHDLALPPGGIQAARTILVAMTFYSFTLWSVLRLLDIAIHHFRRPSYYPQERLRRERLRAERRRIRTRTSENPCPAPEALLAQFARARESPREMIRFGSLLEDLECYVDNRLVLDPAGRIVRRNRGIRGWLRDRCPELGARYKTVMRYKALAKKFRQVAGVGDPVPAAALLGGGVPERLEAAQQRGEAFLAACSGTQADLICRLDPDRICPSARADRRIASG